MTFAKQTILFSQSASHLRVYLICLCILKRLMIPYLILKELLSVPFLIRPHTLHCPTLHEPRGITGSHRAHPPGAPGSCTRITGVLGVYVDFRALPHTKLPRLYFIKQKIEAQRAYVTHSQWLDLAQNLLVLGTYLPTPAWDLSLLGLQVRGAGHGATGRVL